MELPVNSPMMGQGRGASREDPLLRRIVEFGLESRLPEEFLPVSLVTIRQHPPVIGPVNSFRRWTRTPLFSSHINSTGSPGKLKLDPSTFRTDPTGFVERMTM